MPIVNKQQNNAVPAQPAPLTNVLDRIAPVKSEIKRLLVSLYGRPKTGKTRLSATFPKPVLIIGAEDGTSSLIGAKGVDFVPINHSSEVDVLGQNANRLRYRTVVVDSVSALNDMLLREVLGVTELVQKSWKTAGRDEYGECANRLKVILHHLIRDFPGNVVLTAGEKDFKPTGEGSDRLSPTIGSMVGESACKWINHTCGYICNTFIRPKVVKTSTTVGSGKATTVVESEEVVKGEYEYCLRVGEHDMYMTGFQLALSMKRLPQAIVDPSYDKIMALINGTYAP